MKKETNGPTRVELWTAREKRRYVIVPLLFSTIWGFVTMLALLNERVMAQEVISEEEPTPSSVEQVTTPIERAFREKRPLPRFLPWLKDRLKNTPAFFRDTRLNLNIRTYYLNRDKYDDSNNEAWALGGALSYQSGWLLDRFSLGSVIYTSQKISGPKDRDGTLLLKPRQEGYTVLGQLYGRVRLVENNFVNVYRYEYNTPFIGRNDSRMTPNTFEGYTLQGNYGGTDGAPAFRYGAGYITKIKERDSDEFVWMSKDAGASVRRGVVVGGGTLFHDGFAFGAVNYYSEDILNVLYTESSYRMRLSERLGLLVSAQFTDQRSTGDNLLKGSSFSTSQVGVKSDISYSGAVLTVGYTRNAREVDLQNPWSGYPGYTSVQVESFKRAGENALMVKASYDFGRIGLERVTAYALYTHGWGSLNASTAKPAADVNEFNADIQWRPKWKPLEGLWVRSRYASARQYEGDGSSTNEFRVIVNYDFPLI